MNAATEMSFASSANIFAGALSVEDVRHRAPAVFATQPHERMSSRYTFIDTERVLAGLMRAGFVPVDARQAASRSAATLHARHMIRLRRRFETIQLRDCLPEIVFLNSHDGTSAYQLRLGIFRAICTNGLIVSVSAFPAFRFSHRRDVVDEAIAAALELGERFSSLADLVERMQQRRLDDQEQLQLAERALAVRFPSEERRTMPASQLLTCRRVEDAGNDLWSTFNRVQENVMRGGLALQSLNGRLSRTRRITSIKEDVRLNAALWDIASELIAV
jgi:hypothetical protein